MTSEEAISTSGTDAQVEQMSVPATATEAEVTAKDDTEDEPEADMATEAKAEIDDEPAAEADGDAAEAEAEPLQAADENEADDENAVDEDSDEDEDETAGGFADLGLSADALRAVRKLGYDQPTPVQEQAIPIVLAGGDLIAAASTGTGKTAAFLLPLLSNLEHLGRGKRAPRILVVTPTRELAMQSACTCIQIARCTGQIATIVYGGAKYGPQIKELKGGTDVLVATPGRLNDLMDRGVADLSEIETLVLDEADRMLDMGFLPEVTKIVEALPTERQTLLFSATIDKSIEINLGSLLNDPSVVQIAHMGETAATVDQYVMPVAYRSKLALLQAVLDEKGHERVIVFTRTKVRAEECCEALVEAGYNAESIHSDKPQGRRRRTLDNFRKGRTDILVATDVLARGIDVPAVDHVINYDLPDMAEDYIHRIGRTGRAGERGYAISFVSPNSRNLLADIEKLIGREIPVMPLETYELDLSILKQSGKAKERPKQKRSARTERSARFARNVRAAREERADAAEARAHDNGERRQRDAQHKSDRTPASSYVSRGDLAGARRDERNRNGRDGSPRSQSRDGYRSSSSERNRGYAGNNGGYKKGGYAAKGAHAGRPSGRQGGYARRDDRQGNSRDDRNSGYGRRDDRQGYQQRTASRSEDDYYSYRDRSNAGGKGYAGKGKNGAKYSKRSNHGANHRGAANRANGNTPRAGKEKSASSKTRNPNANDTRSFGERKLQSKKNKKNGGR